MRFQISKPLQEWANDQTELTTEMVAEKAAELLRPIYNLATLQEAQEIDPTYKMYGEPEAVATIVVDGNENEWGRTFTVLIDGIWTGDGADINFWMIKVNEF